MQTDTTETYFQTIAKSTEYGNLMEAKNDLINTFQDLDKEEFESFILKNPDLFSNPDITEIPNGLLKIKGAEAYAIAAMNITEVRKKFSNAFPDYDDTMSDQEKQSIMKIYNNLASSQYPIPNHPKNK